MSRILVTGASGQVGSALTLALAEQGHSVRVLLRENAWHPVLAQVPADQLEVVRGNLLNAKAIDRAVAGCERVFHVAGSISYLPQNTWQMQQVNVNATELLVQAALRHGVKRFVHTSSTAAIGYSQRPEPLDETHQLTPQLKVVGYLRTKAEAETRVKAGVKQGLLACMVNPSTILGSGDTKGNSAAMYQQVDQGKVLAPPGGSAVVSLPKVIEGHLLAMEQLRPEIAGERFILSSFNWSYRQLFSALAQARGKNLKSIPQIPRWSKPLLKSAGTLAARLKPEIGLSGEVIDFSFAYRYYQAHKAIEQLGWQPDTPEHMQKVLQNAFAFYDQV